MTKLCAVLNRNKHSVIFCTRRYFCCWFSTCMVAEPIAGFHCHTIIKTIKQIKSRIKEIKKDEYSNRLTKVQVCAMYRAGDIRRNVLLKFIRLCMETPCLCPSNSTLPYHKTINPTKLKICEKTSLQLF